MLDVLAIAALLVLLTALLVSLLLYFQVREPLLALLALRVELVRLPDESCFTCITFAALLYFRFVRVLLTALLQVRLPDEAISRGNRPRVNLC